MGCSVERLALGLNVESTYAESFVENMLVGLFIRRGLLCEPSVETW